MNAKSTISAIIPTFNRAHFVGEAITALLAQTVPVDEIIVWDDGSDDNTRDVVSGFGSGVTYFHWENRGKSAALNAALSKSTGDYIWICDDDDIARPDAAEKLTQAMRRAGTNIAIAKLELFFDDPAGGKRKFFPPSYWPDLTCGTPLRHILEECFAFQNGMLVHRSCYQAVGPFREDLARSIDYEMLIRLATRYPITVIEDTVFAQRQHTGVRGPAHARHAARHADDIWLAQDQQIFKELHQRVPLSLYEAMFEGDDPDHIRRAALVQRASIYARRHLWDLALDDFETAAGLAGDKAISKPEWGACRRAMAGKYWGKSVFDPAVTGRFTQLRVRNRTGRALALGLARGVIWRARAAARAGDISAFIAILRLANHLSGGPLAARAPQPIDGRDSLRERQALPAGAYLSQINPAV